MAGFIILSFSKERRGKAPDAHFSIAAPSGTQPPDPEMRLLPLQPPQKIDENSASQRLYSGYLVHLNWKRLFSVQTPGIKALFLATLAASFRATFRLLRIGHATCRGLPRRNQRM